MSMTQTSIAMPYGDARSFVFTPAAGTGPWPAVILFMDAPAIRPAFFEMGQVRDGPAAGGRRLLRAAARHVLTRWALRADQHRGSDARR